MASPVPDDGMQLELESVIGFNGHVPSGLICHPDREHLIYLHGYTVIIQNVRSHKQHFLHGHTFDVSCVAVSRSGKYLASGQVTYIGSKADIFIWDYAKRESWGKLSLHKGEVQALAFSPNDQYLVSLGGEEDGSVVLWNVAKRKAICRLPGSSGSARHALTVAFSNSRNDMFITGGNETLRVWEVNLPNRKMHPTECQMGQFKRVVTCLTVAEDDSCFYCGTSTGDILKVITKNNLLNSCGPQERFSLGVTCLTLLKTGEFIVGSGDGKLSLCKEPNYKAVRSVKLHGAVTSITLRGQGHQFFVGTGQAQIYSFDYSEFKEEIITTCHSEEINDLVFPFGTSETFATCSKNDIRVWHTTSHKELLRITVPNMTCNSIQFLRDGSSILSAWNDDKIRAFNPESGKLMYQIENAHSVTVIAATSDCKRIVSGGGDGKVQVWNIGKEIQLVKSMLEHKRAVSCIKIKSDNRECVTASTDGACIIWDIRRFIIKQMVLSDRRFLCVCYHPEEFQIITSSTDGKIQYWKVFDGSAIRSLDGPVSGSSIKMDISDSGSHFVTGGVDKLVKVWDYNEGEVTQVGIGHNVRSISQIKICPLSKYIISVTLDGSIFFWKYPYPA